MQTADKVWTILVNRYEKANRKARAFIEHCAAIDAMTPEDDVLVASEISEPELLDKVYWLEMEVKLLKQYGGKLGVDIAEQVLEERKLEAKFRK
jgi:hypothetical protein